jgi:hypothetical protein
MHRAPVAHRYSQEGPRVYSPPVFQQREEEVRTKADAGMPDCADFITGKYRSLLQRGDHRREMAVHADIAIVLDQDLQSARATMFDS